MDQTQANSEVRTWRGKKRRRGRGKRIVDTPFYHVEPHPLHLANDILDLWRDDLPLLVLSSRRTLTIPSSQLINSLRKWAITSSCSLSLSLSLSDLEIKKSLETSDVVLH